MLKIRIIRLDKFKSFCLNAKAECLDAQRTKIPVRYLSATKRRVDFLGSIETTYFQQYWGAIVGLHGPDNPEYFLFNQIKNA